ncbi:MAG TPA: ATP-binding protein [Polyangiaceae bacterium]|nr:ATP-binding protein [Polyangiaceae bacterium]
MNPKVLFVDDDEANLVVCEAMFGEDFQVLTAASGAEALALLRNHEVAVVVSDQRMPIMSGIELLEQVRREFPDAARVLVTAYTDSHAAIEAINRGRVRRYLKKPWVPSELRAEILDGLEQWQTRRRVKELERRLIQTERVYALGIVAAGIGHELRNPISWIATNLQHSLGELSELGRALELHDDSRAASKLEEIRAALQDANTGTERVIEIVSAIQLSMVRPSSESELCDLNEVVRLALRLMEGDLRRSARVELELPGSTRVSGSRTQLSQIVVNLLVNAVHAVAKLPLDQAIIGVRVATDGAGVALEVADSGPGVPEPDRERIFDPFFTTKPGVGTGLGLAISRKIALDLGGSLDVGRDARLGGAAFRLSLPEPVARAGGAATAPPGGRTR